MSSSRRLRNWSWQKHHRKIGLAGTPGGHLVLHPAHPRQMLVEDTQNKRTDVSFQPYLKHQKPRDISRILLKGSVIITVFG